MRATTTRVALVGALTALALGACDSGTEPQERMSLDRSQVVLGIGETELIQAVDPPGQVVWTSSDPTIATVTSLGQVTGQNVGTTIVTAASEGQQAFSNVRVTIPPIIRTSAPSLTFSVLQGSTSTTNQFIQITNDGIEALDDLSIGTIEYVNGSAPGWLSATLSAPIAPATLSVGASAQGLAPGTYAARVPIVSDKASNAPQTLVVFLHVLQNPRLRATPERIFLGTVPGADPAPVTVQIENATVGEINGLVTSTSYQTGLNWLVIDLNQNVTPAVLTIGARTENLNTGRHLASVTVSTTAVQGAGTARVLVELEIGPGARISVDKSSLGFSAVVGEANPAPQTLNVSNGGGSTLNGVAGQVIYPQGGPTGWLSVTGGGTAPTSLLVSAATGSLPIGLYEATIRVSATLADNSPVDVPVSFNVTPVDPPRIAVSPSTVKFSMPRGGASPGAQGVAVTNAGSGTLDGLTTSIAYGSGSGWLSASLASNSAPTLLTLSANGAGLSAGSYTATVTVVSSLPGVASKTVSVELLVVPGFAADIYPFFVTSYGGGYPLTPCTNCHTSSEAPNLTSSGTAYSQLLDPRYVVPGDTTVGRLLCKIQGTCGAPMSLPPAQIQQIKLWIAGGAPS